MPGLLRAYARLDVSVRAACSQCCVVPAAGDTHAAAAAAPHPPRERRARLQLAAGPALRLLLCRVVAAYVVEARRCIRVVLGIGVGALQQLLVQLERLHGARMA